MFSFLHGRKPAGNGPPDRILPDIDAARCVLAGSVNADCTRCADACPHGAIVQCDDMLGIDTDACTGCGLCQPACPQSAISVFAQLPVSGDTAFAACPRSGAGTRHTVACVHGIDLAMLADMHGRGIRRIAVRTGDCIGCPYGRGRRLADWLDDFNRLAESRGLAPLRIVEASVPFVVQAGGRVEPEPVPDRTRRRLLLGLTARSAEPVRHAPPRAAGLVALLSHRGDADGARAIDLAVPVIDPRACTGCDMCIRSCPNSALILRKDDDGQLWYRVQPGACTACGVCFDMCEAGAIELELMACVQVAPIPLTVATCRACGVAFHVPAGDAEERVLCQTCAKTMHHTRLFQVLK